MRQRMWKHKCLSMMLVLAILFSSQAPAVRAGESLSEDLISTEEGTGEESIAEKNEDAMEESSPEKSLQEIGMDIDAETDGTTAEDLKDQKENAAEQQADAETAVVSEDEEVIESEEAALETAATLPVNPRIVVDSSMEAGQKVTWDCVWFGSYPQREVVKQASDCGTYGGNYASSDDYIVNASLYNSLQNASWNSGEATIGGVKYRRVQESDATYSYSSSSVYFNWSSSVTYRYFRYDPIKWRVLNVSGGKALLLADKALDDQKYNTHSTDVTWATSSMRSWLNGYGASSNQPGTSYTSKNFINSAFSDTEKLAIQTTSVVNNNNLSYGTTGGSSTSDKIFLLSESEVYSASTANSYGFVTARGTYDEARRCKSSTFAKAMGVCSFPYSSYCGNCYWWLRSLGRGTHYTVNVYHSGYVNDSGDDVDDINNAVRPALNLNLSSSSWSNAGVVSSDGLVNESSATGSGTGSGGSTGGGSGSGGSTGGGTGSGTGGSTGGGSGSGGSTSVVNRPTTSTPTVSVKTMSRPSITGVSGSKITVKWKKLSGISGYQLGVSTKKSFASPKYYSCKKTAKTKKVKLKKKKKYYIRIRAYKTVNGITYYGAWSKTLGVKIVR